ncbi:redoxin domain-containing protein [Pseudoalteromonas sp. MM17-2]|uniref:TlpA family protein disulfide reductase n=1 Tax=Pseudoalteromonas sp. MM17-2 TaxID=2917753 RepID=UPI001EF51BC5|nr:redoxin family protein [Pseudoalteromonas sp. MM17-2]MCG7544203.1 redoxin domain-containing protein [Pseudoalteromonas sp. MM17-2]
MKYFVLLTFTFVSWFIHAAPLHNIQLKELKGGTSVSLAHLQGAKPLYVKMWASWCSPCMQQMPKLQQHYQDFSDKLAFIAVNIDLNDDAQAINKVVERFQLDMTIAQDEHKQLATQVGLQGTPLHLLFNRQGQLVYRSHQSDEQLAQALTALANAQPLPAKMHRENDPSPTKLPLADAVLFSATWCESYWQERKADTARQCQASRERVNKLAEQGKKVVVVVSNLWTTPADVQVFAQQFHPSIDIIIDNGGQLFKAYQVKALPHLLHSNTHAGQ